MVFYDFILEITQRERDKCKMYPLFSSLQCFSFSFNHINVTQERYSQL